MPTSKPIESDAQFEQRLLQFCRFYRMLREVWEKTNTQEPEEVVRWIQTGSAALELLDESQSDVEAYTGANDLRLLLDEMKRMKEEKQAIEEAEK